MVTLSYIGTGFAENRLSHPWGWVRPEDTGVLEAAGTAAREELPRAARPRARARLTVSMPASQEPCQAPQCLCQDQSSQAGLVVRVPAALARLSAPMPGMQHPYQVCTTHARLIPPIQPCTARASLVEPRTTCSSLAAPAPHLQHPCQAHSTRASCPLPGPPTCPSLVRAAPLAQGCHEPSWPQQPEQRAPPGEQRSPSRSQGPIKPYSLQWDVMGIFHLAQGGPVPAGMWGSQQDGMGWGEREPHACRALSKGPLFPVTRRGRWLRGDGWARRAGGGGRELGTELLPRPCDQNGALRGNPSPWHRGTLGRLFHRAQVWGARPRGTFWENYPHGLRCL